MEEKNKCVRAECSRILWAVLTILLCAAPSLRADVDIPSDGKEYEIPGDFGPVVSGTLWVYGTVNILPDAYIEVFVYATADSVVNIEGGQVGWWIDVAKGATVTVYGTDFKVNGEPVSEGSIPINGTLTVLYENATEPVSLTFDCHAGATVTLTAPGVGPQPVDIDIKPGNYPNAINLGSNGVIPVAILSSDTFDATTVDPKTVFLAGAGVAVRGKGNKYLASQEDVNGDGLTDLVVKIETENLDPGTFQNGTATLTGETSDGIEFTGSDSITIVPPE